MGRWDHLLQIPVAREKHYPKTDQKICHSEMFDRLNLLTFDYQQQLTHATGVTYLDYLYTYVFKDVNIYVR